jgi:alpha-glucoside transport system substrate-binding protein
MAAVLSLILVTMPTLGSALVACGPARTETVTVMALWTGPEEAAFRRVLARFRERTGITVRYSGGPETPAALATAVDRGSPPDVAVLSDPVAFRGYLARGKLTALDGVLDPRQLDRQYPASWLSLMRAGSNHYYAVVVKASLKSLLWYDPAVFRARGYLPPRTWEEMNALSRTAIRAGTAPWCLGLEAAPASGWPGTDWIEDILLHQSGPDTYQRWINGTLPWTSPEVEQAWRRWGQLVGNPGAIDGGARSALITNFANAGTGMFHRNPTCLMDHQPSFITATYSTAVTAVTADGTTARPGQDFDLSPFPQIDPRYANALEVGADLAGMFHDTPQARTLLAFLATPEAQQIWPEIPGSGALSVNTAVPLSAYPTSISTTMARMITGRSTSTATPTAPTTFSFDASDLMPAALRIAFQQAVLQYIADPAQLPDILSRLDRVRSRTYP